jgi:Coenzyme PQQ synthesis protein D (PqqD)
MTPATPAERFVCNPQVTFQRLGDELVLVNLETDMIYNLNATAAVVWEMLQEGSNSEAIGARILAEYDVGEETMRQEVKDTLKKFRLFGLITAGCTPA